MKVNTFYALIVICMLYSCNSLPVKENQEILNGSGNVKIFIKRSSEIEWEQLNPARGDQSPQAGTLWGDRKGNVATGFLAKFVNGFSSPPHIHNVTYRAVVINGLIHNDDPNAAKLWMKPGSFWTQPSGEPHITSAMNKECVALVEIDEGPYLVKPVSDSFDLGERPINIDVSNLIWLDQTKTNWIRSECLASISFLSEGKTGRSLFVNLPPNFKGTITSQGKVFHATVIKGTLSYFLPEGQIYHSLDAGSYFGAEDTAQHQVENRGKQNVIIYIRTNGSILIK